MIGRTEADIQQTDLEKARQLLARFEQELGSLAALAWLSEGLGLLADLADSTVDARVRSISLNIVLTYRRVVFREIDTLIESGGSIRPEKLENYEPILQEFEEAGFGEDGEFAQLRSRLRLKLAMSHVETMSRAERLTLLRKLENRYPSMSAV